MDDIVIEETYPYPPELVWESLTDPDLLADWLMPGDFKPVVGHKLQMKCGPNGNFDGKVDVQILEVDKPRRISYSWKTSIMETPSTVTFFLTPTPKGGTLLRLVHSGFEGDGGKDMRSMFGGGWRQKLGAQLGPVIAQLASKGI